MKSRDSISCHQVGVMAGLLLLVLKLTSLPSLMYEANEIGGVVSIILICIFNVCLLLMIVLLKKKYQNRSIYSIFSSFLGGFITKIIYLVFFVFFMFKLLSLVDDGFGFIRDVADEEFSYFNFLICFFPVICALAYSGIRNMARTCEFFYPFILMGLFVAIIFSFAPINFWGLGSIARLNLNNVFSVLGKLSFWNGDLFAILIFMDKIELKKGSIKQVFSPILIVGAFLITSYVMYFSLYQETAVLHSNMIFDIIEYSVGTSSGWHMDIFAIIIYMVCLFLQGAIYIYCATRIISKIFNFHNQKVIYAGVVFAIIVVQFLYLNDYLKYIVFAQGYLSRFSLILLALVPILLFVSLIVKWRNDGKSVTQN